ncbi:MAG TPA: hypothetical protein DCO77_12175 [Nitrospiraceae bacterium]|nr:hypothetical protein [Nitrospiraceae bacterium]
MEDIQNLIGKEVIAVANGVQYAGVLVEVSENEVFLQTPLQWVVLPASSVNAIRAKDVPLATNEDGEDRSNTRESIGSIDLEKD